MGENVESAWHTFPSVATCTHHICKDPKVSPILRMASFNIEANASNMMACVEWKFSPWIKTLKAVGTLLWRFAVCLSVAAEVPTMFCNYCSSCSMWFHIRLLLVSVLLLDVYACMYTQIYILHIQQKQVYTQDQASRGKWRKTSHQKWWQHASGCKEWSSNFPHTQSKACFFETLKEFTAATWVLVQHPFSPSH